MLLIEVDVRLCILRHSEIFSGWFGYLACCILGLILLLCVEDMMKICATNSRITKNAPSDFLYYIERSNERHDGRVIRAFTSRTLAPQVVCSTSPNYELDDLANLATTNHNARSTRYNSGRVCSLGYGVMHTFSSKSRLIMSQMPEPLAKLPSFSTSAKRMAS